MEDCYLGIDLGNTKSVFYLMSNSGQKRDAGSLPTLSEFAWRTLLEPLRGERLHACFEASPHYDWRYDLLAQFCSEVVMVNPADFAVISRSQRKTDKIDAQKLAEGLRRGDLPAVYVPEKRVREDRRLVSFVHWHSQQLASVKHKIRSLLLGARLKCPAADVMSIKGQAWLEREALSRLAKQESMLLRMLLNQARQLAAQRKELDEEVRKRVPRYKQADVVESIPGFGPLVSLAVLSAVAEITRFRQPGQLASYFGTCGSVHQSGESLRLGALTKRGNVHVRWLLSQALRTLHCKDPRVRQRYLKLKRKKPRGVARAAQVRWLSNLVWWLMTKNEPYRRGGMQRKPDAVAA